ncbi:MAG: cation diffusion facilitator family transporter [Terriglobia bacterium]
MDKEEGFALGERVARVGIWVGVFLTAFEVVAGVLGRSSAIVADASHSGADLLATFAVFVSLKIARKPFDEDHPYGHGKVESVAAAFVALMLLGAGLLIVVSAGRSVAGPGPSTPTALALVGALVAILVRESLFRYTVRAGQKVNSPALIASAWHHRSDAVSSIAALIGVAGGMLGFAVLDPIAAIAVAVLIIKMGWDILADAGKGLMDAGPGEAVLAKIVEVAEAADGVEHAYCRARKMGRFVFVDIKIDVDPRATVETGHEVASDVKRLVMSRVEHVADVMVHINPHQD